MTPSSMGSSPAPSSIPQGPLSANFMSDLCPNAGLIHGDLDDEGGQSARDLDSAVVKIDVIYWSIPR